jgi:hypothetical protein
MLFSLPHCLPLNALHLQFSDIILSPEGVCQIIGLSENCLGAYFPGCLPKIFANEALLCTTHIPFFLLS